VLSKVNSVLEQQMKAIDFFRYPTISDLAAHHGVSRSAEIDLNLLQTRVTQRKQKLERAASSFRHGSTDC
jgi:hypothetical protein